MKNTSDVMGVGKASEPEESDKGINSKNKKPMKTKYIRWMTSLGVSFIPILAIPISKIFIDDLAALGKALFIAFSSVELMFIGISCGTTLLNDCMELSDNEKREKWVSFDAAFLIVASFFYGVVAILEEEAKNNKGNFNYPAMLITNLTFLSAIIFIGIKQYIDANMEDK